MDFNNLAFRLERMYGAIGQASDGDILKYVHVHTNNTGVEQGKEFVITFDNGKSDAEKANIVFPIIEHLAKLKDHLKIKLGSNASKVESKINSCLFLQLIMDLSNAEKHGYPLTRSNRSDKKPKLKNVQNALVIPPKQRVGFNARTGELTEWNNCYITISGEVVDDKDEFICNITELFASATSSWEEFIAEQDIA